VVDTPPVTRALSFGRGADDYDRVRPEYSADALDLVTERLGLQPDADVLDLAAGTGKLTRPLVERFARVTAVEPDAGMLARLRQVTDCHSALEGRAEAIPLPDRAVDAVFVGQAFHWFSTAEALAEIARVLRPAAGLVLIWNAWTAAEPPVPEAASRLIEDVVERASGKPVRDDEEWLGLFDASPFERPLEEQVPTRRLEISNEDLVTLTLSTSPFHVLPPEERRRIEAELRRLVTGEYRLPVETRLYWTRLT
jgi:ubiquinone/menaquinone biosynthesis C-methylase UbiE